MSVTFYAVDSDHRPVGGRLPAAEEPCLCAQDAPSWLAGIEGRGLDRSDLQAHAYAGCASCGGTGVETVPGLDRLYLNLNNGNARIFLTLLGLKSEPWGECSLPDARRAVMVARATFDTRAAGIVREPETLYGGPCVREDGAVELRPVRGFTAGLDADDLRVRLESFAQLLEDGAAAGAVGITWG